MIKISEVLSIYEDTQIDAFLKKYTGYDLNEKGLTYDKIKNNYRLLGDNISNGSTVGQLSHGEKGLVERITNAIDAVIEKQKAIHGPVSPKSSEAVIKKAFPQYYNHSKKVLNDEEQKSFAKDAENQVVLVVNDGARSNRPTFDVIDCGTGLTAEEFPNTILSIQKGNKISKEKCYLIGAFGQGGSTSLPFAYATIILSKKDGKISFTIIKKVDIEESKNLVYVYLQFNEKVSEVDFSDFTSEDEYINDFVNNNETGTFVRMIEADIDKKFRDNEVTKPGMLSDYLNTELFNVGLPVKIIENRANYKANAHLQNRNIYGSYSKLKTWKKYVKKDFCGTINIEYKGQSYNVDYYIVLPPDEAKWGSESECRKIFEQFNVFNDPIIYTANGQTIATEKYTRLSNAGLNFLKYRLLVVINLDILGTDKYKFFTTDRDRLVYRDETKGFLEKVVKALASTENLLQVNELIGEKSVNSSIDSDLIKDISKDVKNLYSKFLKNGALLQGNRGHHYDPQDEEIFENKIDSLEITSSKRLFHSNENVIFVLTTKAQKHINQDAIIYMFVDDRGFTNYQRSVMNGRIQYTVNARGIKPGTHKVQYMYYKNDTESIESNIVEFEVSNEKIEETHRNSPTKDLDLDIKILTEATLICQIGKNPTEKKIQIALCLDKDELFSEVYGISSSSDAVSKIKQSLIKPISLFVLYLGESYDDLENDEKRNDLVMCFIKSYLCANGLI